MLWPSGRGAPRGLSVAWPWDQDHCQGASGTRGHAFVPKENVRGFGWGQGKGRTQGAWGEMKTNRAGKRIRSLSQQLVANTTPEE
ncbi:hypothetical protein CgunFtcFv8_011459 [Champsocephalus gunnari]|uniref:Uncharacterized protein n=1 Tax=Champsocephalus gunnari TaxID=52237 RepID=A0AAN8D5P7_CHAGU|nr:hypothetical protein CgunFtcFv8_011459 [Champsocephalus gunnari]